jgi:hypothetical protein
MARRIHPHHYGRHGPAPHQDGDGERPLRSHIGRVLPGQDPTDAINRIYSYGRHRPHHEPHDRAREQTSHYQSRQPTMDEYRADYGRIKTSPVSPAPDESQPQFKDSKIATHNDASGWVRGQGGESPYPTFDSGPSGFRYDRKRK